MVIIIPGGVYTMKERHAIIKENAKIYEKAKRLRPDYLMSKVTY